MRDEKWVETREVDDTIQIGDNALGISVLVSADNNDDARYGDKAL
jgi:hypothetical protein